MAKTQGHKWFAAFWNWQTRHEPARFREWRKEIAGGARGRVLEIGCVGGANFKYYADHAAEVITTEPDPYMLERARARARGLAIDVREASAEDLPFEDDSLDTVVSTVNMCSIADPAHALGEVRRVLKPGGEYRFFDHVRYQNPIGGVLQDVATPFWKWLGAGCHPNRDIAAMIRRVGLEIVRIERTKPLPPIPPMIVVRPCIKGVAIAP